jgi:hypothetical protein
MHHLVMEKGMEAIRGDRTSIEVPLGYNPPDGKTGELVAELVNDPQHAAPAGGRRLPPDHEARRPRRG